MRGESSQVFFERSLPEQMRCSPNRREDPIKKIYVAKRQQSNAVDPWLLFCGMPTVAARGRVTFEICIRRIVKIGVCGFQRSAGIFGPGPLSEQPEIKKFSNSRHAVLSLTKIRQHTAESIYWIDAPLFFC